MSRMIEVPASIQLSLRLSNPTTNLWKSKTVAVLLKHLTVDMLYCNGNLSGLIRLLGIFTDYLVPKLSASMKPQHTKRNLWGTAQCFFENNSECNFCDCAASVSSNSPTSQDAGAVISGSIFVTTNNDSSNKLNGEPPTALESPSQGWILLMTCSTFSTAMSKHLTTTASAKNKSLCVSLMFLVRMPDDYTERMRWCPT